MSSYRESHLAKGKDYHTSFSTQPRRSLIWEIEKQVIIDIVDRFLDGCPIYHLDFACGTGRIAALLKSRTVQSTGIDVSESMLAVARKENPTIEFLKGDITTDDSLLAGERFNLITAFRFFPNAEPDLRLAVFSRFRTLLRDDGILIFNNHKNKDWTRHTFVRFVTFGARGTGGWGESEVREIVRMSGFEILQEVHIGFLPEWEGFCWMRPRRLAYWIEKYLAGKQGLFRGENVLYVYRSSRVNERCA